MTPQVHSFDDGSKRPITSTVLPYHAALYSNCLRNSPHPTSETERARRRFCFNPSTFKSSSAIAWFSRISLEDVLCRKSFRWLRIFSWASATRTRCLFLLFDPFTLLHNRRCSFANLSSDTLRYRGFSITSPLLVVANRVSPKSTPRISLYGCGVVVSFPVSTVTDMKCLPEGSRETVMFFTVPSNGREHTNCIGSLNLGSFTICAAWSILELFRVGWYDCRPRRLLNLGNPLPLLKNPWYAFSRLITEWHSAEESTSFSHAVSSWSFRRGSRRESSGQLIDRCSVCQSFIRKAKESLYTQRQQPKCFESITSCFLFG